MALRLLILLFLALYFLVSSLHASEGDADPIYNACLDECEKSGCVGKICFQHCKFSSDGKPIDGPWYLQEPLYQKWKQWDCRADCQYHCMISREEQREKRGDKPIKYHGKWPFQRVYGIQEPVAVAFSALSLAVQFHGWLSFFILLNYKLPLRPDKRTYYEYTGLWHVYAVLAMNFWFWSAVFHCRATPFTVTRYSFLLNKMSHQSGQSGQATTDADSTESVFSSKKTTPLTNKRVNIVLDNFNFLLWKQQILLAVRSHRLEKLLLGKVKAPPEMIRGEGDEMVENEEYELFVAQDSALASWLLSTVSPQLLSQFVGAGTASGVWSTVTKHFASQSTTTAMSLHYKLKTLKKGDLDMRTYISQVKEVCDSLAACGSPISDLEKIATVLNGLPIDYKPFIAIITASREPYTFDAVVSVLVDAEIQQKAFESPNNFSGSISVAQGPSENQKFSVDSGVHPQQQNYNPPPYRQQYTNYGRGRGRTRPQCQVCGKVGHLADACWHRFDQAYPGVNNARRNASREESGNVNVCDGGTDGLGFVCTCAGRLGTNGAGSSQQGAEWFVDSGATHHVTPEGSKVLKGAEYTGPAC